MIEISLAILLPQLAGSRIKVLLLLVVSSIKRAKYKEKMSTNLCALPKAAIFSIIRSVYKRTTFGQINGYKTMWSNQRKLHVKLCLQIERNTSLCILVFELDQPIKQERQIKE